MEFSADLGLNREISLLCANVRAMMLFLIVVFVCFVARFTGNLDLCGRQIHKPCRSSMGFPVVLPHAESADDSGKIFLFV